MSEGALTRPPEPVPLPAVIATAPLRTLSDVDSYIRALEERRSLEVEGFTSEISLMRKQVQRLELKAYGRRLPLQADGMPMPEAKPRGAAGKVAAGARSLRSMQARVSALEASLLPEE